MNGNENELGSLFNQLYPTVEDKAWVISIIIETELQALEVSLALKNLALASSRMAKQA
jgi:hypothetical protein